MKALIPVSLFAVVCLNGCAENIREASSDTVAQSTKSYPARDGKGYGWRAPELEVSHYRISIGGYDTLSYGLFASKREPGAAPGFELWFSSHNGGAPRHYSVIKSADGSRRPLANPRHLTERCQEFSNLTNACLYHDSASVELSREELENARNLGMKFILSSGQEDYEHIDLPAQYIQGFLQAIH